MKFLADVNIPLPLIRLLRENGHEVQDATIDFPLVKDIQLIITAQTNNQIILTRDKDFLELTKYPQYKAPLILISLTDQKTGNILQHFEDLLNNQSSDILQDSITVVREDRADSFPLE